MTSRLDEEHLVALTRELIERPTENPPGDERHVTTFLRQRLEDSPVDFDVSVTEVRPDRANVVARAGSPEQGTALLAGHTDVVPADPDEWTGDPYQLRREDGRLIGRGTSDMKGANAAKLLAAEEYLLTTDEPGEIVIAFVVGEEAGGLGMEAFVEGGIDARGAIIGEPTDCRVAVAEKGVARYCITVRGRSSHSGRPDAGLNAITAMQRILDRLEDLDSKARDQVHPTLSPETVTVTEIDGGIAPNVVPDKATVTVDWRIHPGENATPDVRRDMLENAIDGVKLDGDLIEYEIDRVSFGRPSESDPETDVVRAVTAAADVETGTGDPVGFDAITDARYLRLDAGIPTVLFGPGSISEDAHTVDESIAIADLVTTGRVYRRALDILLG